MVYLSADMVHAGIIITIISIHFAWASWYDADCSSCSAIEELRFRICFNDGYDEQDHSVDYTGGHYFSSDGV